jgi:hypothetical protein
MTRTLAHHIGWVLACSLLASQATAVAPYTATDREERQEPWLQALRAEFDPDLVLTTANEFATNGHLVEMAAELEAQKRELSGTDVDFEDLDDQLLASVNRLVTLLDSDNSCSSENPPTGCTTNIVIVWRTIFLAAYVLAKHDDLSWSQSTKDAAQALFRSHDLSYKGLSGLGNTSIPVIGTRLLGGLALDDAGLRIRGETEFVHAFDEDIRRGIPEPMSPHYAGPTLSELALLIDGLGPECSAPCAAPDLTACARRPRTSCRSC